MIDDKDGRLKMLLLQICDAALRGAYEIPYSSGFSAFGEK
jgi:hypothetical protein